MPKKGSVFSSHTLKSMQGVTTVLHKSNTMLLHPKLPISAKLGIFCWSWKDFFLKFSNYSCYLWYTCDQKPSVFPTALRTASWDSWGLHFLCYENWGLQRYKMGGQHSWLRDILQEANNWRDCFSIFIIKAEKLSGNCFLVSPLRNCKA